MQNIITQEEFVEITEKDLRMQQRVARQHSKCKVRRHVRGAMTMRSCSNRWEGAYLHAFHIRTCESACTHEIVPPPALIQTPQPEGDEVSDLATELFTDSNAK